MKVKNNLTMKDTIAGLLLTTTVEEYNKKKLELPVIDNSKHYIKAILWKNRSKIANSCARNKLY